MVIVMDLVIVMSCIGDKPTGISCGYLETVYSEYEKSLKRCPKCGGILVVKNGVNRGFYK